MVLGAKESEWLGLEINLASMHSDSFMPHPSTPNDIDSDMEHGINCGIKSGMYQGELVNPGVGGKCDLYIDNDYPNTGS